jgi:hypothetical protein
MRPEVQGVGDRVISTITSPFGKLMVETRGRHPQQGIGAGVFLILSGQVTVSRLIGTDHPNRPRAAQQAVRRCTTLAFSKADAPTSLGSPTDNTNRDGMR